MELGHKAMAVSPAGLIRPAVERPEGQPRSDYHARRRRQFSALPRLALAQRYQSASLSPRTPLCFAHVLKPDWRAADELFQTVALNAGTDPGACFLAEPRGTSAGLVLSPTSWLMA